MTARQIWEGMLTELNKVEAPNMLLEDFNYFLNKAVNQYVNKRYNIYDINQQTTDDLRVLKANTMLDPTINTHYGNKYTTGKSLLFGATYEVILPDDYLHMLNCICIYKLNKNHKCYNQNDYIQIPAKRLTADAWSIIVTDPWNRPTYKNPYYYIHNVNTSTNIPTNLYNKDIPGSTDLFESSKKIDFKNYVILEAIPLKVTENSFKKEIKAGWNDDRSVCLVLDCDSYITFSILNKSVGDPVDVWYRLESSQISTIATDMQFTIKKIELDNSITSITDNKIEFPRTIKIDNSEIDLVDKPAYLRHINPSLVRCEIRYGNDNSVFELKKVMIDYIKAPLVIRLTQELIDLTEDTSLIMEFSDPACQEIINELVHLVMENFSDPRLRTHPIVTLSIANPVQQLSQPEKG